MKLRVAALLGVLAVGGTMAYQQATAEPSALQCRVMPVLLDQMHDSHIEYRKATKLVDERTVELYLEYLDPGRSLLTIDEAEAVEDRLRSAVRMVRKGQCETLDALQQDQIQWTHSIEDYVEKLVSKKKFDVDKTVELVLDPDDRKRPTTPAEREELWRKLVHIQLAGYLSRGMELDEAKNRVARRYQLQSKRVEDRETHEVYSTYLDSVARALDPHSTYFSPDQLADFRIAMELKLEGIGAVLTTDDGYTVVREIVKGGAADRNGQLKADDKIVAVSQAGPEESEDVIDMELRKVVKRIRGNKGTPVTLSVLRDDDDGVKSMDITIVRDSIDLEDKAASLKVETREVGGRTMKLGVLDLPGFYGASGKDARNSDEDVRRLLDEAHTQEVDGLVLDLSENGGGLLDHAITISGYFIGTGPVVGVAGGKDKTTHSDKDPSVQWDKPLVVLTSRLSASASEIVAAAVKDHGRGVLVGDPTTFGKGSVQQMQGLPMGLGALKITTDLFFSPGGRSNQNTGVAVDVVVQSPFDLPFVGEAALKYPLEPKTIDPMNGGVPNPEGDGHWDPITGTMIETLAQSSASRVKDNEDLQEIAESLAEAKARTPVVKVAELLEDDEDDTADEPVTGEDSAKGKTPEELAADLDDETLTPQMEEALNVLADLVDLQGGNG
ncbi:MAG: PDZ domain-containing protein [Deltaproteobacteria bacterium]|nr:PDZ domain-containing protein [Deltaproteobacteria bacterium]